MGGAAALVILLTIAPSRCAQNAPLPSSPASDLTLDQIVVEARQPTEWNDPQWNIRDIPDPECNGSYRTFEHDISLQDLAGQLSWAEMTNWSINAIVEFDGGKRGSLLTDTTHVRLFDHDGKFWFLRLLPAAQ